jgi:hypothetical protein
MRVGGKVTGAPSCYIVCNSKFDAFFSAKINKNTVEQDAKGKPISSLKITISLTVEHF